jgi:hypothetical protein
MTATVLLDDGNHLRFVSRFGLDLLVVERIRPYRLPPG